MVQLVFSGKHTTWIPARAVSAAADVLAATTWATLSACARSKRPFKNARNVNSPAHPQKRTLCYNLSVSESCGKQKTSQEDGGMSFKPQGEEEDGGHDIVSNLKGGEEEKEEWCFKVQGGRWRNDVLTDQVVLDVHQPLSKAAILGAHTHHHRGIETQLHLLVCMILVPTSAPPTPGSSSTHPPSFHTSFTSTLTTIFHFGIAVAGGQCWAPSMFIIGQQTHRSQSNLSLTANNPNLHNLGIRTKNHIK